MSKSSFIVGFKSIEVRAEVVFADGTTVERVWYERRPEGKTIPLSQVKMNHTKPLETYFSHPADLNPSGYKQAGPVLMELRVENWDHHGTLVLNDGTIITVKDAEAQGMSVDEMAAKKAQIRTNIDPLVDSLADPKRFSRKG